LTHLNIGSIFAYVSLSAKTEPGRKGRSEMSVNRMRGAFVAKIICVSVVIPILAVNAEAIDFKDDFEMGDVSSWSAAVGAPSITPPAALRITDVWIRDPHFFADYPPFVPCTDLTVDGLPPYLPSANAALATKIATDDDGDGYLDLSVMLLFRPWEQSAVAGRVDVRQGACDAPDPPSYCFVDTSGPAVRAEYDGLVAGTCLEPVSGTTNPSYSPVIEEPGLPCFRTRAIGLYFEVLGDLHLLLEDAQISAEVVGSGPDSFTKGLIMGFLREDVANSILIPASYPVIGGTPISKYLPGGTGNCAGHSDMDEGNTGWWFYLNFTAENVPWTGL
jgi:hypothetical protein